MALTFRSEFPISRTMAFELEHHENLRLTLHEKRQLLKYAIVIWMWDGEELIGETYGVPLHGNFEAPPGCPNDPHAIYCYSNTILKKYQRKGYGSILKAAFLGRVSAEFRRVYGHARPGASQALNLKFGAQFGEKYVNWYGTGEDYRVYVLELGSFGVRKI